MLLLLDVSRCVATLLVVAALLLPSSATATKAISTINRINAFSDLKLAVELNDFAALPVVNEELIKIREAIDLVERFGWALDDFLEHEDHHQPPLLDDLKSSSSISSFEQPMPCPLGTYCREGVVSPISVLGDYMTPQPCYDGFFCPPGSTTPEGSGPCPTGYYCPTPPEAAAGPSSIIPMAIPCPTGSHCPGVANIEPLPCERGTYSAEEGQSVCTMCGVGEICPHAGLTKPQPCTAGYVCDSLGLSLAERECPPSFYCEEGTATSDPDHPTLKGPILCGPGVYCHGGVAHNSTKSWIPTREEGKYAPQICGEGYYCDAGSSRPDGSGPCPKGSYCPPGSSEPIPVPVGTYSGEEGAIAPTLCSPGYYAPVEGSTGCIRCSAGHSCEGYGTYEPRICAPGTYRSRMDSITCKLCPAGTFAPYAGSSDISQCLPCPDSRVCGVKGMLNLSLSEACDGGYHCSAGTNRARQHDHKCPAGHVCGDNTHPSDQYAIPCSGGHYCERGTALAVGEKNKCKQSHYCASGTPASESLVTRCPRQTFTYSPGATNLHNCRIQTVDICDKQRVDPSNMFEDLSYHPLVVSPSGSTLNPNTPQFLTPLSDVIGAVTGTGIESKREIVALTKVLPGVGLSTGSSGGSGSSTMGAISARPWTNDTVELFRSCPPHGLFNSSALEFTGSGIVEREDNDPPLSILLIGRNFRNSTMLTCRFRPFIEPLDWNSSASLEFTGRFISPTRMECPRPSISSLFHAIDFGPSIWSNYDASTDTHEIPPLMQITIDVSNDGQRFSGDERFIPYTSTSLEDSSITAASTGRVSLSVPASFVTLNLTDVNLFGPNVSTDELEAAMSMDKSTCLKPRSSEESPTRAREQGWYELPFMRQAHLSFDWRHIPIDMKLDEHFKLSIYARPSRCDDTRCNDERERISDVEESPCLQPLELPKWFVDPTVSKHQVTNMTLLALDDALIRVEIQIIDGLYLSSADSFLDTMTVHINGPSRAKTLSDDDILYNNGEKRHLSPFVSWEEREVNMEYFFAARITAEDTKAISPPLNMPPRWDALERGRLLLTMNTTHESTSTPTIKDEMSDVAVTNYFWDHPYHTHALAKEATDAYLETFHGLVLREDDGSDSGMASYDYEMTDLVLPYLPFLSNCREFDSHVPIWALFESHAQCSLPEPMYHSHSHASAEGHQHHHPTFHEGGNRNGIFEVEYDGMYDVDSAHWWRRQYHALPHRDDVRAVGPYDLGVFYPIADWCERKLYCQYEEELGQTDILPRWFEAETGTALFSILRDPINYNQYTGRGETYPSADDGGGQKHVLSIQSPDTFIPVNVDRTAALELDEDCAQLCFPRTMTLDVAYYQMDQTTKRIVEINLIYDDFDRDPTSTEYEVDARFRPLDYRELIIKFAYSRGIFCFLFVQIGLFTVAMAAAYWLVARVTTRLQSPPKLRFLRLWSLILPPAASGFLMGLLPPAILTIALTMLMRGQLVTALDIVGGKERNAASVWPVFKSMMSHYVDSKVEPRDIERTLHGRTGIGFVAIAIVCLYEGSKMFIPKIYASSEDAPPPSPKDGNSTSDKDDYDHDNGRPSNRVLTMWKRSNMIYTSIVMAFFLVLIVEWSYWRQFGNYIWEAIIFLKLLSNFIGGVVENQLGEALLTAPILTAMGLVEGLVTLSANDFVDFLLSYIVGFGFLLVDRMYIGPLQGDFMSQVSTQVTKKANQIKTWMLSRLNGDQTTKVSTVGIWNGASPDSNGAAGNVGRGGGVLSPGAASKGTSTVANTQSVEPIIDSYCSYCSDTLSLLYAPYLILLLIMFRDETEMAAIYGIKEQDMEYYILFALLIIPFQIATDVFIHGALELFHGWRLLDYLSYARYRFLQREWRWKGIEESLDECIDEGMRTLDQQCFSSQWYFMMTVHTNGIMYMVLGIEMMARAQYNLFGDPAMPLIIAFVVATAILVKKLLLWTGLALGLWRVRKDRQNWHLLFQQCEEEKANLLHAAAANDGDGGIGYEMERRIASESFRHKFLDYNRSWLIDQLPSLLTPRTQRRSQGYLIPQLNRILQNLNTDISSDSDDDDGPIFDNPALDREQREVMRSWVHEARDRILMRTAIQPLLQSKQGSHCQRCCLSTHVLCIKSTLSFGEVYAEFSKNQVLHGDQAAFRNYFDKKNEYETICEKCLEDERNKEKEEEENAAAFDAVMLNDPSQKIILQWRQCARGGQKCDVSSDDESDDGPSFPDGAFAADDSSQYLITLWLRKARARRSDT